MRYFLTVSLFFQTVLAFTQADSLKFNIISKNDSVHIIVADYGEQKGFYSAQINTSKKDEIDSLKKGFIPYNFKDKINTTEFLEKQKDVKQKQANTLKKLIQSPVIDFDAVDTEGVLHRPQNYLGRVLILHFWNFWDSSFENEIPILNKMYEKHKQDGIQILSFTDIVLGKDEQTILQKMPISFPLIANSKEFSRKFLEITHSMPYLIMIDKQGKMRYFYIYNELSNSKSDFYIDLNKQIDNGFENKILTLLDKK